MVKTLRETLASKRRQTLTSFTSLGLSESKLLKVFEQMKAHPEVLDMDVGRKQLGAATRHLLKKACFSVQLPLQTPDGDPDGELDWVCGDFGKLLDDFTHDCKEYGDLIRELQEKKRCTIQQPWSLVIYFDEATPGDPLRLDHVRKSMCVYVAIKELGPTMLKHERCWIPCGVLRANQIKRVPGKWSACFKLWLRGFFLNPRSSLRYGVSLRALKGKCLFFSDRQYPGRCRWA
jgi:hypothetical protein